MSEQRERGSKMSASKRNQKVKGESQVDSTFANATEKAGVGASRDSIISDTLRPSRQASASIDSVDLPRQKLAKTRTKGKIRQADGQVVLEPKRQAQIKTKLTETGTKSASAKARKTAKGKAKSDDTSLFALGKVRAEERVSFVVRVTIDERGQPLRTEVEHAAHSGKKVRKGIFPTLDVEQLAAFIRACIASLIQSEPVSTTLPSSARPGMPTPQLVRGVGSVVISEVMIFRANTPGIMTVTLKPDEDFLVQTRFRLEGPDASSVAAQESSCQIKVFAQELSGGASKLLTTYKANLVKDVLEYAPQAKVTGLSPGLYRLITAVTLHTSIKMAAHHARLIIHVPGIQASANPAPSGLSEVSSTRVGR